MVPAFIRLGILPVVPAFMSGARAQHTVTMYCNSPGNAGTELACPHAASSAVGLRLAGHGVVPIAAGGAGA